MFNGVETDLIFDTAIDLVMSKVPIAAHEKLYKPEKIMSVDVIEKEIELQCSVI